VLVIVFFVILALYIGPTINFVNAWRQSHAQEAALVRLRQQNVELQNRAKMLSDPGAMERAARRQGMVVAGELPYSIQRPHR
jgi:cell division protein FtsB